MSDPLRDTTGDEAMTDPLKALAAKMRELTDAMNAEAKACDSHSFAPDRERHAYCSGKGTLAKSVADRLDQIAAAGRDPQGETP